MGIEGEPPTADQVAYIRERIFDQVDEKGKDAFDERDLRRIRTETAYVERFFMHMYDLPGKQEDNAVNMAMNTLKWRKEQKVHEIVVEDLNPRLKDLGELYCHGRDKDGKVLMVFAVKKHIKGTESMDELKKFFIYCLERIDRENNGDQLTLVFDCAGCGLKNMDMELIQYMIQVFKDYYPWSLNYILVFEMPWVLNAAWKIIKGWLPAGAVKKIKFLTKTNIGEYVDEDQRPPAWGGIDDWEYQWEEEEVTQEIRIPLSASNGDFDHDDEDEASATLVNGGIDESGTGGRKKSVHFAEMRTTTSTDSIASQMSLTNGSAPIPIPSTSGNQLQAPVEAILSTSPSGPMSGPMSGQMSGPMSGLAPILTLTPQDEISFTKNSQGDLVAKVAIKNISPKSIAFKIKTTSPEKFRVRPSMSSLAPGTTGTIEIQVHFSHLPQGSGAPQILSILAKDKFLITAATIPTETSGTLSHGQLNDVMKSLRPEVQYRLRCGYSVVDSQKSSSNVGLSALSDEAKLQKQMESLNRKVSQLSELNESLSSSIESLKWMIILALLMLTLLLMVTYFWSHPSTTQKLFQEICLRQNNGVSSQSEEDSLPITEL